MFKAGCFIAKLDEFSTNHWFLMKNDTYHESINVTIPICYILSNGHVLGSINDDLIICKEFITQKNISLPVQFLSN